MTVRFTVATTTPAGPAGWMHVVVHDTVEELRAAATRYSPHEDFRDAEACFQQPAWSAHADDEGYIDEPGPTYAGVMRLTPDVGAGVVAHECTHAALGMLYRQHVITIGLDSPTRDEEALCYAVGDLMRGVTNGLLERGVWTGSIGPCYVNLDRDGLDELIAVLKRARRKQFGQQ